jgi:hypothetical protein
VDVVPCACVECALLSGSERLEWNAQLQKYN